MSKGGLKTSATGIYRVIQSLGYVLKIVNRGAAGLRINTILQPSVH